MKTNNSTLIEKNRIITEKNDDLKKNQKELKGFILTKKLEKEAKEFIKILNHPSGGSEFEGDAVNRRANAPESDSSY